MLLNPEHIKDVLVLANDSAYFQLLSISIRELGVGYSVVEMKVEEKHLSLFGGIHGGAYSSLIDTAAYWALYCELDEASGLISVDVSVDYLVVIKEGILIAKGRTTKFGKIICFAEAKIFDATNRIVASGTSKLIVKKGTQTIEQARQLRGMKPLHTKFLD